MPEKELVVQSILEGQKSKSFPCLRNLEEVRYLNLEVTMTVSVSVLYSLNNQFTKFSNALILDHIKRCDVARHKTILNVQRMHNLKLHLQQSKDSLLPPDE